MVTVTVKVTVTVAVMVAVTVAVTITVTVKVTGIGIGTVTVTVTVTVTATVTVAVTVMPLITALNHSNVEPIRTWHSQQCRAPHTWRSRLHTHSTAVFLTVALASISTLP